MDDAFFKCHHVASVLFNKVCLFRFPCFDDGGRFSFGHIREKILAAAFLLDSNNPLWAARENPANREIPKALATLNVALFQQQQQIPWHK